MQGGQQWRSERYLSPKWASDGYRSSDGDHVVEVSSQNLKKITKRLEASFGSISYKQNDFEIKTCSASYYL